MTTALPQTPTRVWIIIALAVLALHLIVAPATAPLWRARPAARPAYEVSALDAATVEAMRKQWERQRALLEGTNQPASETPPEQARYASDRDIRVEREQRARRGEEGARPGTPGTPRQRVVPGVRPRLDAATRPETRPLQNLGVPLPSPAPPAESASGEGGTARGNPRIVGEGAEQQILDDSLPEGDLNLLNAVETRYYSFFARLYEAVLPLWRTEVRRLLGEYRMGGARSLGSLAWGDYITHIEVRLSREGELLGLEVARSSEIPEFDRAAQFPFRKLGRFPTPPTGLIDERGEVSFTYQYLLRISEDSGIPLRFSDPQQVR